MVKGGFTYVDLGGATLSGTATAIPGAYNAIVKSQKPIVLMNIKISTKVIPWAIVPVLYASSTSYDCYIPGAVDDTDGVDAYHIIFNKSGNVTAAKVNYKYTPAT